MHIYIHTYFNLCCSRIIFTKYTYCIYTIHTHIHTHIYKYIHSNLNCTHISSQSAESMIKIARRLEMEQLEQQCWKFLMTVLNDSMELLQYEEHVEYRYEGQETRARPVACIYATKFHELADKYDCPVTIGCPRKVIPNKSIHKTNLLRFLNTAAEVGIVASVAGPRARVWVISSFKAFEQPAGPSFHTGNGRYWVRRSRGCHLSVGGSDQSRGQQRFTVTNSTYMLPGYANHCGYQDDADNYGEDENDETDDDENDSQRPKRSNGR